MFKLIKKLFEPVDTNQISATIKYLSESCDHADLERRLKEINQRGINRY